MMDWKTQLAAIGDDYLIGLANKGIVNRAYKDKGEVTAEILSIGEEASVKVGEETVTVRIPLGDSRCTCPSRSICRHVILGILTLKERCGQTEAPTGEDPDPGQQSPSAPIHTGATKVETVPAAETAIPACAERTAAKAVSVSETATPARAESTESKAAPAAASALAQAMEAPAPAAASAPAQTAEILAPSSEAETLTEKNPVESESQKPDLAQALAREIAAYPVAALRKAMGTRNFQTFLKQLKAGGKARISRTSVTTVQLPGDTYRVTLISPLEYSSCTCHKKELCAHKAEALLWCKLQDGSITEEELTGELLETPEFQIDRIREAAEQMKDFLLELLDTGLPRTSPDILNNLERLALVAHQAALANFEGYLRSLQDSYQRYLKRVASFQTRDLLSQLTRLYRRVCLILETQSAGEIAKLAGEFRAEYLEAGSLDLRGVATRDFESQSGYAGKTVYFLEENTQEWYTYTMARPVFYDTKGKRRNPGKAQAPWGLEMSLEEMTQIAFHLTAAKCDMRGRLSSSQDSRAEIKPVKESLRFQDTRWYYQDFQKLFQERIRRKDSWLLEQEDSMQEEQVLVFLQPAACQKANFDDKAQKLFMPLYDGDGREVTVEITYSKKEDWGIRYLERIHPKNPPCFFGRIYLRDGKIRMYPIAVFDPSKEGLQYDPDKGAWKRLIDPDRWLARGKQEKPGKLGKPSNPSNPGNPGNPSNLEGPADPDRVGTFRVLSEFLEEVLMTLEITLQSGFDAPTDAVLEEMGRMSALAGQYGMSYLERSLGDLCDQLKQRRHSVRRDSAEKRDAPARILCGLMEYVYLCREKTAYDNAAESYRTREEKV